MRLKAGVIALVVSALTVGAVTAVAQGKKPAGSTKITICHKTGAGTFHRITVSSRSVKTHGFGAAVKKALGRRGDVIVVGDAACPSTSATPPSSNTPPQRIEICHRTGSKKHPYVRITVSSRSIVNPNSKSGKQLRGHMRHQGDMLMPGANACPTTAPSGTTTGGKTSRLTADLAPVAGASGSGSATFTINAAKGQLCFTLTVDGLGSPVTAAHIHRGSTGDIVVPLTAPTSGSSSGCVTVAKALLRAIADSPAAFYVNVHTQAFTGGQIRGDLSA